MKRVISTALAFVLLLGLGALAVLALPGAQATLAPTNVAAAPVAFQSAAAPDAPLAAQNWNAIVMVLDATTVIPDAETLSQQVAGVQEVLVWDALQQLFISWIPDAIFPPPGGFGTNFSTHVGEPYLLKLDASAPTVFSLVGDVPPPSGQPGAVQFNLVGDATACKWNYISLPLDMSSITDAEMLSLSIGDGTDVDEVLMWDATQQYFVSYIPDVKFPPPGGFGTNFPTKIGYPYFVCVSASGLVWP